MKPNYTTTIHITKEENDIVEILQGKGIRIVSIFRRALQLYEKELRDNGELK